MAKFALKVAAITFAAIVAILTTIYLIIYAVAPMGLAEFYYSVGNYSLACGFADRGYSSSGCAADAAFACKCAAALKDDELIIKESESFLLAADYNDYCAANAETAANLLNKYVTATYAAEGGATATDKAFSVLVGYDYHNVAEALIAATLEKGDGETLSFVLARLKELDRSELSNEQIERLDNDIELIEKVFERTIREE